MIFRIFAAGHSELPAARFDLPRILLRLPKAGAAHNGLRMEICFALWYDKEKPPAGFAGFLPNCKMVLCAKRRTAEVL